MSDGVCDVTIIGGGVVGMATAMALTCGRHLRVTVIEAEEGLARQPGLPMPPTQNPPAAP